MNERSPHELRQAQPDFDFGDAQQGQGKYQPVHGRFNLVLNSPESIDVIQETEDNLWERYLVVPQDSLSERINEQLQDTSVPLLEKLAEEDNFEVYRVAIQAKPLINEKLFPDHESTDTYISDRELFQGVGTMWREIYDATSRMPEQDLLSKTGMLEFTKGENRLFPVPPFNNWSSFESSQEALENFEQQIQTQLQKAYPSMSTRELFDAARIGFLGK